MSCNHFTDCFELGFNIIANKKEQHLKREKNSGYLRTEKILGIGKERKILGIAKERINMLTVYIPPVVNNTK